MTNLILSEVAVLIKNPKKHTSNSINLVLIFLLLLTLSLILPCNFNANALIKTGDINNNGLVNMEDVATDNSTLRNCIQVSTQITEHIH